MTAVTFIDGTVIPTLWLNDVNTLVWSVFGGAVNPAAARSALGIVLNNYALVGTNNDITSLAALTTALSRAQGGAGLVTNTALGDADATLSALGPIHCE